MMLHLSLTDVALLLTAFAVAAPLARWLGVGTVLGYLLAGVALGPYGIIKLAYSDYEAKEFLHFAEFGIVLLLFLIGLELRPKRLWAMRDAIFGLGGAQMTLSALFLACVGLVAGMPWQTSLFIGLALALSSTAFALQVLEENGELTQRHGRNGFAVLLFQDLAAIPLIALAPMFAIATTDSTPQMDIKAAITALGVIAAVVIVGHFALDRTLRMIARTRVKEAMTAAALLTVLGVTIVMQRAGLSAPLGAFIAGALLAESSYRHQLEADIQPFEGLLLGLFFTAVGMSLNLSLMAQVPLQIVALAAGLVAIKTVVLYGLGRWKGLDSHGARRLGLSLSQGGEFAFVLLTAGATAGALSSERADLIVVVVTLSMAMTPLLLILDHWMFPPRQSSSGAFDTLPENDGHVIIAGFGRYGQIVARVLSAKRIAFTALEVSPEQVEFVKSYGNKAFFGDASRPEILDAAQAGRAQAFVLAIDDIEASMRTAEVVTQRYPDLPIYARARNRNHAHRLLDLGIENVERETFRSALETTRELLQGLGRSSRRAERAIETFKAHDARRLIEDYKHYSNLEKLQAKARSDAATLARLFEEDTKEEAVMLDDENTSEKA